MYLLPRIYEVDIILLIMTMKSHTPLPLLILLLTSTTLVAAEQCRLLDPGPKGPETNVLLTQACTCGACKAVGGALFCTYVCLPPSPITPPSSTSSTFSATPAS
ncbi:hypothetical protein IWZ03DRAFT_383622 [Phyllosticta citriasiana]|uniref:Uncharacterized protein n=1 Tax=Phyllosticta citriasiana TaxID=595635 RepID=A0ABR1KG34_9PEZI